MAASSLAFTMNGNAKNSVVSTHRVQSCIFLLWLCTTTTSAFSVALRHHCNRKSDVFWSALQPLLPSCHTSPTSLWAALFEFTPNEMEELIVSISQEPTDEARRKRMSCVFAEALAELHSERFTSLFDQVLIIVGDRVQIQAQQKALQDADQSSSSGTINSQDFMAGKSAEQKQLWALVDMMVQSKIIVKRANESFGSQDAFQ